MNLSIQLFTAHQTGINNYLHIRKGLMSIGSITLETSRLIDIMHMLSPYVNTTRDFDATFHKVRNYDYPESSDFDIITIALVSEKSEFPLFGDYGGGIQIPSVSQ